MRIRKSNILTQNIFGPAPIAWVKPFDDQRSPFRIVFSDNDPSRGDMKFISVRKMDGSPTEYIVKATMADALASNPSPQVIAHCREHLGCGQSVLDPDIAAHLKGGAETSVDGILPVNTNSIDGPFADDSAAHDLTSLLMPYARIHALLLWLRRNPDIPWGFDGDADWCVAGYRLLHAGVLDQQCRFTPGTLDSALEEVQNFLDISSSPIGCQ